MSVRSTRSMVRVLAVGAAGALSATLAVAGATSASSDAPTPGLRLIAPASEITAYSDRGGVYLEPSVYLASYGEGREYWAKRPRVSDPVTLKQTIVRGDRRSTTTVPSALVDGMNGFKDGMTTTVTTDKGKVVSTRTSALCPGGGYERQRVDQTGPTTPVYPYSCGGEWFTQATVFGIEQGWASSMDDYTYFKTKQTSLTITHSIRDQVADFLGIPADARSVSQHVTVLADQCSERGCLSPSARAAVRAGQPVTRDGRVVRSDVPAGARAAQSSTARSAPATSAGAPASDTVPDLISIPAWGIGTEVDEGGVDRLDFNANEWNGGAAPMVVEGFRRANEPIMDAYQMFYRNGRVVGSKLTGTMEFHEAPEHHHWHFLDFAKYDLVRMDGSFVTTSGKQSWCLAPTNAINLALPNAVWQPDSIGLGSSCGSESALWLRETMPVGWGDTYNQYQTTAFDLTDVRNGKYQIKVTVNPNGNLYERTTSNNVSLRTVIVGGTPGARTVTVPKYQGVDTETGTGGEDGGEGGHGGH